MRDGGGRPAGAGGEERVLTKEEAKELKQHLHCLSRMRDPEHVGRVVDWVQQHVLADLSSAAAAASAAADAAAIEKRDKIITQWTPTSAESATVV